MKLANHYRSIEMKIARFALLFLSIALLASCHSKKTYLPYFNDIAVIEEGILPELPDYKATIKPDDELGITITSPSNLKATLGYNAIMPGYNTSPTGESLNYRQLYYLVNEKGDITMPVLGEIHVAGLTIQQLQDKLTDMIRKDVSDAIVKVELINFYIYVAGEVARPSKINVTQQRYSIIDALAEAGDLTQYGERSNIMIIRNEDGKRVFKHLDLNSSDILSSPYFYLRQGDYIYVQPNEIKQSNSRYDSQNAYKLQVTSTIVSAISVIASLVIALAIK